MTNTTNPNYILSGKISNKSGEPIQGLMIMIYSRTSNSPNHQLGRTKTNDKGAYEISFPEESFDGSDIFIEVRDTSHKFLDEEKVESSSDKKTEINFEFEEENYHLSGKVSSPSITAMGGLKVIVAEKLTSANDVKIIDTKTDESGHYQVKFIYRKPEGSIDSPRIRVRVLLGEDTFLGETTLSSSANETIDVQLDEKFTDENIQTYHISGKVSSSFSSAVGNLTVVVVKKHVGGDTSVIKTHTDESGNYQVKFIDKMLQESADLPDFQVRIFQREDNFLDASEIRYDASIREVLNVQLSEESSKTLPSEIETLTSALKKRVPGNLRDLKENDDQQDITYLANKTGWDAKTVALAALADKFSDSSAAKGHEIEAPLFYAMFRSGLPANEESLYQTEVNTLREIWKQAIENGVIPKVEEVKLAEAINNFKELTVVHQELAAENALKDSSSIGVSSLKEMLTVSLGDNKDDQKAFARIHTRHKNNPSKFWEEIHGTLGEEKEKRLRLDGQLAYLTLNNAPVVKKLHAHVGNNGLKDPVELIGLGLHRAEKWKDVVNELSDKEIPKEIKGESTEERRANYAEVQAAQLRLSYPTAVVAKMVKDEETSLLSGSKDQVHDFLMKHQGKFELGRQPLAQYIHKNKEHIQVEEKVVEEVTRIQRVYQITPDDKSMNAMLKGRVDSAAAAVRYGKEAFTKKFKSAVGGKKNAELIHAKAQQVHNTVLNVALNYLTAKVAPGIGVNSSVINPTPANASDVIAYPALESLFGEMDYCECDHCQSVLSPAAYMVDLLQFIDLEPETFDLENPLDVLLSRRPDLQHIQLSCENTNTPLPYIDVVNEVLEHYVVNELSLDDYRGHDTTDEITSSELLANPQFVSDEAYKVLAGKSEDGNTEPLLSPAVNLPFHRPLENLRRYFNKFETPLPRVMEALRKTDDLERGSNNYGWRDIWMEELLLSRAEYRRLTNDTDDSLSLQQLYGFPSGISDTDVIDVLSNAKAFTRRMEISYEDLVEILKTHFINPHSVLIPKWEKLGISLATIKAFKDGAINDDELKTKLPSQIDESKYGGNVNDWLKNEDNYKNIMSLILLTNTDAPDDVCSFDKLQFRYADPGRKSEKIKEIDFIRLLRFIRLWKKLGWSIEQTDKAMITLYPDSLIGTDKEQLDEGFKILLPRLGVMKQVMDKLKLNPKRDLLHLLACFAPIDIHGLHSLYRDMFLSATMLELDDTFADDGYSNFLEQNTSNADRKLQEHAEALRAAFELTGDELAEIITALKFDEPPLLALENISKIFRHGWLAKKLKLSVREFSLLKEVSGVDPFASPDLVTVNGQTLLPPILRFLELHQLMQSVSIKPHEALYLIWDKDISQQSSPEEETILNFARVIREGLATVDNELIVTADPNEEIARERMTHVYGADATDLFFGLLGNTFVSEVSYNHHPQSKLEPDVLEIGAGHIAYDSFRKILSWSGVFDEESRDKLKQGKKADFQKAVDELFTKSQKAVVPFFDAYPELEPLHGYVSSIDDTVQKRFLLLEELLPELKKRRKQQFALQVISDEAKVDIQWAKTILQAPEVLHAVDKTDSSALSDLTAISDRNSSVVSLTSGSWEGYIQTPENGFYNLYIEVDAGVVVEKLSRLNEDIPLKKSENEQVWSNQEALEFTAGRLYKLSIKAKDASGAVRIKWRTPGQGQVAIPARFIYSSNYIGNLRQTYIRFLKALSLSEKLGLGYAELSWFAAHNDYKIKDKGWLNSLPVGTSPDKSSSPLLLEVVKALLKFAETKKALSSGSNRLLEVLQDPDAVVDDSSKLLSLTRWNPDSLDELLKHWGEAIGSEKKTGRSALKDLDTFYRAFKAQTWLQKIGISAPALISATTNEPDGATVRNFQNALRARHNESDWIKVIQPINDELRALQRNALVAYILHQMRSNPKSEHINTPEKLFEYFLMDVQMQPCTVTSRIRHALSTIQLFIDRCLMGLEMGLEPPRVSPASIKAEQWQWRNRYRVWEANRKVFLWPENWLEPELRDDQSPFFKETMSELLQSDITEERATTALLNYLQKLDEVAKLEPCGMHYEENESGTNDDIAHVVARTSGANRKYFYRRKEYGSWTPWEQIRLDIEDNPVVPVVWKGRLFLFWLRIFKEPNMVMPENYPTRGQRTNSNASEITIKAILCWSQFYGGKWQPTNTSEVDKRPALIRSIKTQDFDQSQLKLYIREEARNKTNGLRIIVEGETDFNPSFFLYNTHSSPGFERRGYSPEKRAFRLEENSLIVDYDYVVSDYLIRRGIKVRGTETYKNTHIILTNILANPEEIIVEPTHLIKGNIFNSPFLYGDKKHVFWVSPARRFIHIREEPLISNNNHNPEANRTRLVSYKAEEFSYKFEKFYHPFTGNFIEKSNKESLKGFFDPNFIASLNDDSFFDETYEKPANVKHITYPKEIDLDEGGTYSNYNWELLFHIPLTIAVHLSKSQRFAEAQRWFHYIFDPTCNDTSVEVPQRFWKFLRFREVGDVTKIDQLLMLLSKENLSNTEIKERESLFNGLSAILNKPFQPHAIARTRHLAYQYNVVMKYLDNLIAWGDHLFRQDTIEAINEATQRYVLVSNILGARPQTIPKKGNTRTKTFKELKDQKLDAMGNALVELEGQFPFHLDLPQTKGIDTEATEALFGIGRTLYFCVPRNEKMLRYWDTVADRLFKIRNCMNVGGTVRQLALFDPPIDPGMLTKAAAAGIDIGSVVSGLNQPIGPIRSLFLIQKSLELAGELRGLGSSLLAAIEKGDSESMALLRQGHEIKIQEMSQEVRFLQWKQAQEGTNTLLKGRDSIRDRYIHYTRLLGIDSANDSISAELKADRRELTEESYDETYEALVEQYEKPIVLESTPSLRLRKEGRLRLLEGEYEALNGHADRALLARTGAAGADGIAGIIAAIPDTSIEAAPWGIGISTRFGGMNFSNIASAARSGFNIWAQIEESFGQNANTTASYERRADDWVFQANQAARELMNIGKQLIGALISEQVAYHEYQNIQQQIENSKEVDQFLRDKFSNEQLYGWMQGEISRLYYEYYRFAFDTARRAEQTMKRELMRAEIDERDFIKFNYWDSGRKGLLSGEALYLDCKRLEMAYHEHNKREYELTKHISLKQLNPLALLSLKATGTCEVTIPEWLFDMDNPGHYMRRLKNVSLSIPCVTGPYSSVNCTLTLLKSSVRKSTLLKDNAYKREDSEDERFADYYSATQSIVTSSANNDSGLFETNLRDERFLPFEGYGVISTWKLELPSEFKQFDYDTISDIILHMQYTARQGGNALGQKATSHLSELVEEVGTSELALPLSLKNDFPTEWNRFVSDNTKGFSAQITKNHFPYFVLNRDIKINELFVHKINKDGEPKLQGLTGASKPQKMTASLNSETKTSLLELSADKLSEEAKTDVMIIKYSLEASS